MILPGRPQRDRPRLPRHCVWEITTACNLRCVHCEVDAEGPAPDELSTAELLDLADDLVDAGCIDVSLTGGEPLLRARSWPALARRLADHGVDVKVVTNGLLVDAPTISKMSDAGVTGVSVSIDGVRDVHDAFRQPRTRRWARQSRYDAAIAALKLLVESPLRTAVITLIHQDNIDDLGAIYSDLAALGIDAWQLQLTYPLGRLKSAEVAAEHLLPTSRLPELEETIAGLARTGPVAVFATDNIGYYGPNEPLIRCDVAGRHTFWTGCAAGCRALCICSNGDVKGCPSQPAAFIAGNVRDEPFAEIWADDARFAYNTRWDDDRLEGDCAACPHRRLCRAGCTTMAYALSGTIYDNPCCIQRARS